MKGRTLGQSARQEFAKSCFWAKSSPRPQRGLKATEKEPSMSFEDDGMRDQGAGYPSMPPGTWTDSGMQREAERKQRPTVAGQAAAKMKALFDALVRVAPKPAQPANLRASEYNIALGIVMGGGTLKADIPGQGMTVIRAVHELHFAFGRDARFYHKSGRPLVGRDSIEPPEPVTWIPEAAGVTTLGSVAAWTPTPGLGPQEVAKEFLRTTLADGATLPARDVLERAQAAGIAKRTLKRAMAAIGVISSKSWEMWTWRLP
jgi:hypothetical protein